MKNELAVVLPQEVAEIAKNVSVEKRNEVQAVLNHVFNGVSKMREQLDGVVVNNEDDKVNMKLANTIRLGVRQVRLEAEKTFDAKRAEVQMKMLSYKTEDSLWLKAKQTMQILTKEIEENARWKEETKERFEAEQKELKIQQRMLKVAKVAPEILRSEFENMSDETFEMFYSGIEKAYNDRVELEKKAEEERIAKEKAEALHKIRKEQIIPYWGFVPLAKRSEDFSKFTESEWKECFDWCVSEKKKDDDLKEAQRIENERLKKQVEEKEKALEIERNKQKDEKDKKDLQDKKRNKELKPYIIFIRDYSKLLNSPEKEYQKELAEIKIGAEQHYKAETKAREKAEAERKAKEAAEKKAKNAPDKIKLTNWVDELPRIDITTISMASIDVAQELNDKMDGFKKWAKTQIDTL